jgi:DNA helicase IV
VTGPDHNHEIDAEQAVVDRAYRRLDDMRADARAIAGDVLDQGAGGTHAARLERDVRVAVTERRLAALRVGDAGLVFGRIDRVGGERLHIGRIAIADEHNEPLVVDWRAPAAEPFYRATARHPMGLARRRHLLLKGRRVVGIDDELLGDPASAATDTSLLGEGALLAALEQSRTGRMGDIVATIQREQDEVIRAPLPGILVVQGGPGTGKTAVALHRAAYLLYTHRFPLERAGVLLVGPNRIFLRYIEQVLPALGEYTATLATPATLVPTPARGVEPAETAALKGDPRMARVVARAVADRERPLPRTAVVLNEGRRLTLTPGASRRIVEGVRRPNGAPHNARRRQVVRSVVRHLFNQADTDDLQAFRATALAERSVVEALERMWPVLTPEELLRDLFGSPALIRSAAEGLLSDHERGLLHRPRTPVDDVAWTDADLALIDEAAVLLGPRPARRPRDGAREDQVRGLDRERAVAGAGDVDALMRRDLLRHLEAGDQPEVDEAPDPFTRTFGHVLVDEAQDFSPMQLRMLARRCPGGSMTLVGDLGQAGGSWTPRGWDDVLAHLPVRRPPAMAELTVNYRTPAEAMDLAARVLAAAAPGLEPPRSVRQAGVEPEVTSTDGDGLAARVAAVARAEAAVLDGGKVAVIAPPSLVAALAAALPEAPPPGPDVLDAPLALLTVAQAKGLEFDGVVVVEPCAIVAEAPGGRRALYVALTRTTRRLHLVHSRRLPPELSPADARLSW